MKADNKLYYKNIYKPMSVNRQNPSFCAVHPANYFVKNANGILEEITDEHTVKHLQRKLIGWLNKIQNDFKRGYNSNLRKETEQDKNLRERLVRFFVNNDKDYANRRIARSFYYKKQDGKTVPFIFTGYSTDMVESAGKRIGQTRRAIKMSFANETELDKAKTAYFQSVTEKTIDEMAKDFPKDTIFNAYYSRVTKGKKVTYQLYNAEFKKRMI